MPSYYAERDMDRTIARAAKQRDWDAIDRVLEEQRLCGNQSVMRGFRDADKPDQLPSLAKPSLVTIHDLPSLDDIEIVGGEGDSRKWRKKKAA